MLWAQSTTENYIGAKCATKVQTSNMKSQYEKLALGVLQLFGFPSAQKYSPNYVGYVLIYLAAITKEEMSIKEEILKLYFR